MSTGANRRWRADDNETAWAQGIALFAGVSLAILGLFQFLEGLVAALKDDVFVSTPNYVVKFNLTTWGWIHMVVGAIAVAVGILIIAAKRWGYGLGIAVAGLSAIVSFAFMPYYPWWSLVVILFDVAVVWSLCTLWSQGARHR
ncbi:DUF7144 family membrane protein [Nocardioides sp. Iso805N]|uniref:DUF7144 family membrane protein n=1 Tax=Nocardioides sp. Iso805N TaxID=1283287 RepID=UPI00037D0A8C|nr:hypothetical protein [Nocardioides sp. Iso805N]